MAFGMMGAAYAMWSDTIFVNGTVDTGSVDLDFSDYSSTWVYKNLSTDACELFHVNGITEPAEYADNEDYMLVSYATITDTEADADGSGDEAVTVEFDNLFPLEATTMAPYCVDFIVKYNGSIPAHITAGIQTVNNADYDSGWLEDMWDAGYIYVVAYQDTDNDEEYTDEVPVTSVESLQLHNGDTVKVYLCIYVPQNPEAYPELSQENISGKSGAFEAFITAYQWNEDYNPR